MMIVNINDDICQLKECDKTEKDLKIQSLKKYILQIIILLSNKVEIDISRINEVRIIPITTTEDFWGVTTPILKEDNLLFNLDFGDKVISWLKDDANLKYNHAISIIAHELYHCKEMLITSQYINYKKIYFYNEIDTTYDFILDFAKKLFSEYYAYYYSSSFFSPNTDSDLKSDINDSSVSLFVLNENAKSNLTVPIPESFLKKINSFMYRCVKHLAIYHFTNDEKHLHIFDKYKDNQMYYLHYKHYLQLNPILKEAFALYPQNMSEGFLIEYGKNLLSIFNLYSLNYSTDDLSDNFVLKYIGK